MDKVFFSNITRTYNKSNDDLYELLKIDPAKPIPVSSVKPYTCEFEPRNDKQYIQKKKSKLKVKTVRDIRNLYEKDIMIELPTELEKQQNLLLRKIKSGTARDEKTKLLAKNMLSSNKPLTRSSWQMLMNINPEDHKHSIQYVLWNGKYIRVNGSHGGKNKFICNYDIGKKGNNFKNVSTYNKVCKKKGLLRNSLSVNFKPGPLSRKEYLDKSYQKHHVGNIDIINLPKPGLEIQPIYGSALDSTICNFVNSLREKNGIISEKWAEFAVSVVGSVNGPNIKLSEESPVTFDLNYQHNQTKLLMRRDEENKNELTNNTDSIDLTHMDEDDFEIMPEVRVVMEGILNAVEINLTQDNLIKEDDETRNNDQNYTNPNNPKEKLKRKYCELDRLDVTVIRLLDDTPSGVDNKCHNSYCVLGCVCNSLQSTINLRGHCGRVDCMFKCKCDYSKHKGFEGLDKECPNLLPDLLNLNNKINCNLSKEEQKFHQTVILTGDKSILLKSKKRNTKSSKKYAEFYGNLALKPDIKLKPGGRPVLAIIEPKLNCENIEPLCMVHNLYKCFCKGRFEESFTSQEKEMNKSETVSIAEMPSNDSPEIMVNDDLTSIKEKESYISNPNRTRPKRDTTKKEVIKQPIVTIDLDEYDDSCARVNPYEGRKYSDGYYTNANSKILDMEKNDATLRKRLMQLTGISTGPDKNSEKKSDFQIQDIARTENEDCEILKELLDNPESIDLSNSEFNIGEDTSIIEDTTLTPNLKMIDGLTTKRLSCKPKLVAWLESSYQLYKRRLDMGHFKATLEAPKKGKVALYPWDFILSRYSERKNLFLVTKESPYRIFMAVNAKNPFFENCINIDDIRFADLNKYPTSVINLLTNTNGLKDYFCILFGLSHCWEFIGSVAKVGDLKDNNSEDELLDTGLDRIIDQMPNYDSELQNEFVTIKDIENLKKTEEVTKSHISEKNTEQLKPESSKWFIMTIEKDFTEIQFYNRGFFVKYASIIQAIDVARTSGKTVRLSSQKLADNNGPQFGIYAVPSASDHYVFVGPYEIDEPLGIETVKSSLTRKGKRTRGVWISTSKLDNIKVIDNPLSFMPPKIDMVPLENNGIIPRIKEMHERNQQKLNNMPQSSQNVIDKNKTKETMKVVKPIKIPKSNGFYHLTKKSLLKSFNLIKQSNQKNTEPTKPMPENTQQCNTDMADMANAIDNMPVIIAGCKPHSPNETIPPLIPIANVTKVHVIKPIKPVAEVAPQIKITAVYSESSPEKQAEAKKKEGCMFILKPEEINQRIERKLNSHKLNGVDDTLDVEYFLDNSDVCPAPINLLSDEENSKEDKAVFIECKNVELGAIRGTLNANNCLSFVFPGFKASEFYEPDVAFTKINQVLSRKAYMPKHLTLEWHIVDCIADLRSPRLLESLDFDHNVILTERGLERVRDKLKTYSRKDRSNQGAQELDSPGGQRSESSQDFEKDCQSLEDQTEDLLRATVSRKEDIAKSLIGAIDTDRNEYADRLNDILSNAQE